MRVSVTVTVATTVFNDTGPYKSTLSPPVKGIWTVIANPRGAVEPATVQVPERFDEGDIAVLGVKTPR